MHEQINALIRARQSFNIVVDASGREHLEDLSGRAIGSEGPPGNTDDGGTEPPVYRAGADGFAGNQGSQPVRGTSDDMNDWIRSASRRTRAEQ
jgi:hypothetical protein